MRSPSVAQEVGPSDGFWLPKAARARLLSARTDWESLSFAAGRECGRECAAGVPGAVTARWPRLTSEDWTVLLETLAAGREAAPSGMEFWARLRQALLTAGERLADPAGALQAAALGSIPGYTGYSPAMIASTLAAPEMWDMQQMTSAFVLSPTLAATTDWQHLPGLPGRLRFFPHDTVPRNRGLRNLERPPRGRIRRLPEHPDHPLFGEPTLPGSVVGYGAGNVPGTALIIVLLALCTTLVGKTTPVVLVRNSRREPIFSPLVLNALEEADADLVASVAVLVWDYDDHVLQERLLSQADLVIAAAGDDTIGRIAAQIAALPTTTTPGTHRDAPRFHPHGHKVSFSAVAREILESSAAADQRTALPPGEDLLDVVALLAALDSVFWDQNGCLSSRVHFVERRAPGDQGAVDYAMRLTRQMRRLAHFLPRGAWPRRHLHDSFDRYKALESDPYPVAGSQDGLRVLSDYDDDFVVVLDQRSAGRPVLDRFSFTGLVNDCRGRVVAVRPVDDLMQIPTEYLSLLPSASLQSMSVAAGRPGEPLTARLVDFAAACGARGATALRTVGRGAFPQLAYSWDGFLPLDLVRMRPAGHFTTIEFDVPFDTMMETYWSLLGRMSGSGPLPAGPQG